MSFLKRFKVGDILSNKVWGTTEYEVLEIGDKEIHIKNLKSLWDGWWIPIVEDMKYMVFNKDSKSPIERKIAFMRERFEQRNEPTPKW